MGLSIEYVLSLPADEMLAWYVAFGEQRGGKWHYEQTRWARKILPPVVLAIPAVME
jgi:hypothetical protein